MFKRALLIIMALLFSSAANRVVIFGFQQRISDTALNSEFNNAVSAINNLDQTNFPDVEFSYTQIADTFFGNGIANNSGADLATRTYTETPTEEFREILVSPALSGNTSTAGNPAVVGLTEAATFRQAPRVVALLSERLYCVFSDDTDPSFADIQIYKTSGDGPPVLVYELQTTGAPNGDYQTVPNIWFVDIPSAEETTYEARILRNRVTSQCFFEDSRLVTWEM